MTVIRRKFGKTGWAVSEISFGAWQLGGQWGAVNDDESVSALLSAYEAGINFVDTAQMYGLGHSETIVGRSLRQWNGEKIYVATKVQPVSWPSVQNDNPSFADLYPIEHLEKNIEDSRRRLNVDCIDLYQLHCWAPDGLKNLEWFEVLSKYRDQGKISKIGVSIRDYRPEDGIELAESGLVDSIQVIYNIFEQEPDKQLFEAAETGDTAIIARVVLDSGALSGTWNENTYATWEEGSVLHTLYRDERFAETLERLQPLVQLTKNYYPTLAEAAVRFALSRPQVSTAILGMTTAKRIRENLAFSDGAEFPIDLRGALKEHEWRRNYYV
ncbi:MAG: aldo/keto reductase [Micrococcales bacterium]